MSNAKLQAVHAALERTDGDIPQAAVLLDTTKEKLYSLVYRNADLRARWTTADKDKPIPANTETTLIHRPALTLPDVLPDTGEPTAEEVAAAMEKEDKLVQSGLEAFGMKGDQLKLVQSWQKFYNKNFKTAFELIGGGITSAFIGIAEDVEEVRKALAREQQREHTPETEAGGYIRSQQLMTYHIGLLEAMGKTFDRATKAVQVQAMIKGKLNRKPENSKPRGFLKIEAHPGSKQEVHLTQPAPDED